MKSMVLMDFWKSLLHRSRGSHLSIPNLLRTSLWKLPLEESSKGLTEPDLLPNDVEEPVVQELSSSSFLSVISLSHKDGLADYR